MIHELDFRVAMIGNPSDAFLAPLRQSLSPDLWRRVDFKDHLSPADIAAQLSAATMLLFPTRVDNSPNAVKEAVVAGVPVVASDVGGIPDYVQPGKNGILFKTGDLGEFTNAIRQACRHLLFRAGRVAPESLEGSRAYLSPARMGERFLETYRSIAARAPLAGRTPVQPF
jgi:glycosyltransferase involved in cell wall biosynthesis